MTVIFPRSTALRPDERRTWLDPSLLTLRQHDFETSCSRLMQLVEPDYAPTLIVGIRTGGLLVAESMVRTATTPVPVLPVTCRRAGTGVKSRLPMLRAMLAALPRPTLDFLRRMEHRLITVPRGQRVQARRIVPAEIDAIAHHVAESLSPARVLVADDAVDSGATLHTVLQCLRTACPHGTQIRSAAITQTLRQPAVMPDYALYHATLCRFPWSFDARD